MGFGFVGTKTRWTDEELDRLYRAAEKYGTHLGTENMLKVSAFVGSKTPVQCMNKIMQFSQSERITHEWLEERLKAFKQEFPPVKPEIEEGT